MTNGKLAVLIGGQYGSEGKGAIARKIADDYDVHVRVGSPNAGHTIYWNGEKHVMQSIPCGWINPNATIIIGRGALINIQQLLKEIAHVTQYYPDFLDRLKIDAKAGILDEHFRREEGGTEGEMHRRIGSTGEGVGPARIARLQRDHDKFHLFEDVATRYGLSKCKVTNTPRLLADLQDIGMNILIEGTQGSGLSLLHSFWPYCTSIDTNVAGIISEVGIAPARVTDVIMVVRTYPIRVAGNSGPMRFEITWEELNERIKNLGGNEIMPEKTTVTKKVRRIAEWDDLLYNQSVTLNAPTSIALTFADYIDPSLYNCSDCNKVANSELLKAFIKKTGIGDKLRWVSTGPDSVADLKDYNGTQEDLM